MHSKIKWQLNQIYKSDFVVKSDFFCLSNIIIARPIFEINDEKIV